MVQVLHDFVNLRNVLITGLLERSEFLAYSFLGLSSGEVSTTVCTEQASRHWESIV